MGRVSLTAQIAHSPTPAAARPTGSNQRGEIAALSEDGMTDPSTLDADPPAWSVPAGWFGTLLGLLWLVDPAAFRGVLPGLAVLLLVAGLYGVCRHLAADARPVVEGSLDR